jgi:hypothetical protein
VFHSVMVTYMCSYSRWCKHDYHDRNWLIVIYMRLLIGKSCLRDFLARYREVALTCYTERLKKSQACLSAALNHWPRCLAL